MGCTQAVDSGYWLKQALSTFLAKTSVPEDAGYLASMTAVYFGLKRFWTWLRRGHRLCPSYWYCIVLYCIVLYCIVLYCIVLYCIVSYRIVTLDDVYPGPHSQRGVERIWGRLHPHVTEGPLVRLERYIFVKFQAYNVRKVLLLGPWLQNVPDGACPVTP